MSQLSRQMERDLCGMAGVFFVATELSRMRYVVSPTWRNYPSVDLFVLNPLCERRANIQVKTHCIRQGKQRRGWYPLGRIGNNDFFVFVEINDTGAPEYSVIPNSEVRSMAQRRLEEWNKSPNHNEKNHFLELEDVDNYRSSGWEKLRSFLDCGVTNG